MEGGARRNLENCWRQPQNFSLSPSQRYCRISSLFSFSSFMTNTIWAHDLHRHILERLKRRNLGKCFSSCDRTFPLSPFRVRREIQKQDLDSRKHILEDPARRNLGNCWRRRQNFSLLPSRRCCRISLDRGTWVLHGPSSKKVGKH